MDVLFLLSSGKQVRTKLSQAFNHWLNVPEDKLQVRDLCHTLLCPIETEMSLQISRLFSDVTWVLCQMSHLKLCIPVKLDYSLIINRSCRKDWKKLESMSLKARTFASFVIRVALCWQPLQLFLFAWWKCPVCSGGANIYVKPAVIQYKSTEGRGLKQRILICWVKHWGEGD